MRVARVATDFEVREPEAAQVSRTKRKRRLVGIRLARCNPGWILSIDVSSKFRLVERSD